MRIFLSFLMLLFFFSCTERFEVEELYGRYAPINYKSNFDTIQLRPGGVYHRKVYDRYKKKVLEMTGEWRLLEGEDQIELNSFYMNFDDDLVKFPSRAADTNMVIISSLETHLGYIRFCTGYYRDSNCYRKVETR